jgi:uncharacterized membrane protein
LVFAVGALLAHRPAGWFVAGVFAFLTLMLLVRKRAPATLRRHRTSQVEELS